MQRVCLAPITACVLLVALGLIVIADIQANEGPIYTVAGLEARVARNPAAWLGRTIWVRGTAQPCPRWNGPTAPPRCVGGRLSDGHPRGDGMGDSLPLAERAGAAALGWMRQFALVGRIAPPQQVHPWLPATYRVLLEAAPAFSCGERRCYHAVLLDAAPGQRGPAARYELF